MKCLKLYILKEDGYLKNRLTKFELIASKYTFSFLSFLVPGMVYQPGGSALGIELKNHNVTRTFQPFKKENTSSVTIQ